MVTIFGDTGGNNAMYKWWANKRSYWKMFVFVYQNADGNDVKCKPPL